MLLREAGPIVLARRRAARRARGRGLRLLRRAARARAARACRWRWQHVMVFGNVKGALSMAAVLALPADLPYRDRLVAIVFGVTLP